MRFRLLSLTLLICIAGLAASKTQAAAAAAVQPAPVVRLQRLLLAPTDQQALSMPDPGPGHLITLEGLPLFDTPEFRNEVGPLIGLPITDDLIHRFATIVSVYVRAHDRLTVNVAIPKQNASTGVVRLVIQVGRYKDIIVRGNHWFSTRLIEEKLGVKPGDEIRVSQLDKAISWINDSPFRYTKALINNRTGDPTRADLIIAVQDAAPFRLIATYDNAGVPILGSDRYTAAFQWGNAWGLDHQITYQYTRSDIPRYFQAHSLDYRIPLPWRHTLQFDVAYASVNPTFGSYSNGNLTQKGANFIGDVHYVIPVNRGPVTLQYSFGVDFKRIESNLEFVSPYNTTVLPVSAVDTLQANAGVTYVRKDKHGGWSISASANFSPGYLTTHDNLVTYQSARKFSQPRYLYATLNVQRLTEVGAGWELVSKLNGQMTSTNLQGSEQMSIGGSDTVRGYDERIFNGDQGVTFTNELQTPVINAKAPALPASWKSGGAIQARGLAFIDFGDVKYHLRDVNDIQLYSLTSAGLGIRCAMGQRMSVSFDYGWRLRTVPYPEKGAGRGSIRVSMSY